MSCDVISCATVAVDTKQTWEAIKPYRDVSMLSILCSLLRDDLLCVNVLCVHMLCVHMLCVFCFKVVR